MSSKTAPESSSAATAKAAKAWSLAGRLTLWYVAYSFVFIVAFAGFLYWVLVHNLESEDDQFMAEKAEIVRALLRGRGGLPAVLPLEEHWSEAEQATVSIYLRVFADDGRTLLKTDGMDDLLPPSLFPPPQQAGPIQAEDRWISGRCFRIAALEDDDRRVMHLAMDRTQEKKLIAAYRWYLALALTLVMIGCTAMGHRIARRGLRPVVDIADTARRIRSSTLNERINTHNLPTELLTLAETFNAMLDRLEQSFERLRQFSANIAHELRTPINNVRGELEVALGKPRSGEEYREVLGSSLEECGRLAGMIDGMLFLARAENPQTQIERELLDVSRELIRVREFYEAAAGEHGVRLEVVAPQGIAGRLNRALFQRALANLVDNALKHTVSGGVITLSAGQDADTIRVEVADTGQGIPAEHLPHVFDRFYRVDPARSSTTSVGLGLAIVRSIVELHGGTVEIASTVERGTRVVLSIPREESTRRQERR